MPCFRGPCFARSMPSSYGGRESMLIHAHEFYQRIHGQAHIRSDLHGSFQLANMLSRPPRKLCKRDGSLKGRESMAPGELFFMLPTNSLARFNTHLFYWSIAITRLKGVASNLPKRTI